MSYAVRQTYRGRIPVGIKACDTSFVVLVTSHFILHLQSEVSKQRQSCFCVFTA